MTLKIEIANAGPANAEIRGDGSLITTLTPGTFSEQIVEAGHVITIQEPAQAPPPPPPPPPPNPPQTTGNLAPAVTAWKSAHALDKVVHGGLYPFVTGTAVNGGGTAAGQTFVVTDSSLAIRQHGPVTAFRYNLSAVDGTIKFLIYRLSSGIYTAIGETPAITPVGTGEQLYVCSSPIITQPGDVPAIWMSNTTTLRAAQTSPTNSAGLVVGNPTSFELSSISPVTRSINVAAFGPPPFLVVTGDSEMCAHGSVVYAPFLDGGISGSTLGEPAAYLRGKVTDLEYQNFAKGGQTWAFVASVISQIVAVKPRAVVVHCLVNDIFYGRSWTDIVADMQTVKAALDAAGILLFIEECFPWTASTDAQALTVRSYNANTAGWCAENGATLILCHDAMGQTRPSTGHLDDLLTAYDKGDGTHLTVPAGITKHTDLEFSVLDGYSW